MNKIQFKLGNGRSFLLFRRKGETYIQDVWSGESIRLTGVDKQTLTEILPQVKELVAKLGRTYGLYLLSTQ